MPTKEIERPASAQVTAMPRSVAAPRHVSPPTLQEVREAPAGEEQLLSWLQAVTIERPAAQGTPVTRISLAAAECPLQLCALTPTGASDLGAVEVDAGGSAVCVLSDEEPHPPIATAIAMRAKRVEFGRRFRIDERPI